MHSLIKMDVRKNLYDLQHQKELNNLNISLIILVILFVTFIFSSIPIENKEVLFILKFFSVFIVIILALIIIIIFNSRLSQTKEMIEELGKEEKYV